MTIKHLTGKYPSGYSLLSTYRELIIDTTASVGGSGVYAEFNATIYNHGTVKAGGSYSGVSVGSGAVINGSAAITNALISGYNGVDIHPVTTVTNFGTIHGAPSGGQVTAGVNLFSGGTVTNGTATDTAALISGYDGVLVGGVVTLVNNGIIKGVASAAGAAGVSLASGTVTNGSSTNAAAVISGSTGIIAADPATVTNFGTITGVITSVEFMSGGDRLIAEAGSVFVGAVAGGGGTLELAGGSGTITGLGVSTKISGSVSMGGVTGFAAYVLDKASTWTLAGAGDIAGGASLADAGAVIQTGALKLGDTTANAASLTIVAGAKWTIDGAVGIARGTATTSSLTVNGTLVKSVSGGTSTIGVATIDAGLVEAAIGRLDFVRALTGSGALRVDAGAVLETDSIVAKTLTTTFNGGSATLALKATSKFASTIAGFAPTDVIDLIKIAATGASINGSDQLVIVNGGKTVMTLQLTGSYSGATFSVGSDGAGGTDVKMLTVATVQPQAFVAAMARMGAPGSIAQAAPATGAQSLSPMIALPRIAGG